MDSIFVKEVHPGSSAYFAGLLEGDRLLAVNGVAVVGSSYAHVVSLIQQTPKTLTLQVVPKNYDLLQAVDNYFIFNPLTAKPFYFILQYFGDTAHNPETNRRQAIYGINSIQQIRQFDTLSERQESLYGTLQSLNNRYDFFGSI